MMTIKVRLPGDDYEEVEVSCSDCDAEMVRSVDGGAYCIEGCDDLYDGDYAYDDACGICGEFCGPMAHVSLGAPSLNATYTERDEYYHD